MQLFRLMDHISAAALQARAPDHILVICQMDQRTHGHQPRAVHVVLWRQAGETAENVRCREVTEVSLQELAVCQICLMLRRTWAYAIAFPPITAQHQLFSPHSANG